MTAPCVWFTGSLTELDGSDTSAYGEPCEPGQGYTNVDGFVDLDWSLTTVFETRDEVRADVYPGPVSDGAAEMAAWLADTIGKRLGVVEGNDGSGTWYASDSIRDGAFEITLAAHAHGFPDQVIAAACTLLAG